LCTSALLAERTGDGLGFPFDRPQLEFVRQVRAVGKALKKLASRTDLTSKQEGLRKRALAIVEPLEKDRDINRLMRRMTHKCKIFDGLRKAMRLGLPGNGNGLKDEGEPVDNSSLKRSMRQFKANLKNQLKKSALPFASELRKLVEQIDRHWDGLFRQPITLRNVDGTATIIQPNRTNNILEHFFRDLGHDERRRTGTNLSAKRLNSMLPQAPLTANLKKPEYVRLILKGAKNLEERFAQIDPCIARESLDDAHADARPPLRPTKRHGNLAKRIAPQRIASAGTH
jgi:hypothetical protein